ncbi:RNA polymerase-associated protein LEO1 [Porphyridium purpureum]|uniref:RNA polymerase-associated protein LEO1 n=1 Tax=Porphyridium purpureum TaxID=35688 RepID=A0A5J4YWF8_PORPP|nr:RNA polymerase-associated protein LEO1 [Porphyridium purpureum]|eukprot:POR8786..scf209_3
MEPQPEAQSQPRSPSPPAESSAEDVGTRGVAGEDEPQEKEVHENQDVVERARSEADEEDDDASDLDALVFNRRKRAPSKATSSSAFAESELDKGAAPPAVDGDGSIGERKKGDSNDRVDNADDDDERLLHITSDSEHDENPGHDGVEESPMPSPARRATGSPDVDAPAEILQFNKSYLRPQEEDCCRANARFSLKLLKSIDIESHIFDPQTFSESPMRYAIDAHNSKSVIRWRNKCSSKDELVKGLMEGKPLADLCESNTRLTTWSDGSRTLQIGEQIFFVQADSLDRIDSAGAHQWFVREEGGMQLCDSIIAERWMLRRAHEEKAPALHAAADLKRMAALGNQRKIAEIAPAVGPEAEERHNAYEEQRRAREFAKLEAARKRREEKLADQVRARQGGSGTGGFGYRRSEAAYLEGQEVDEDDEEEEEEEEEEDGSYESVQESSDDGGGGRGRRRRRYRMEDDEVGSDYDAEVDGMRGKRGRSVTREDPDRLMELKNTGKKRRVLEVDDDDDDDE